MLKKPEPIIPDPVTFGKLAKQRDEKCQIIGDEGLYVSKIRSVITLLLTLAKAVLYDETTMIPYRVVLWVSFEKLGGQFQRFQIMSPTCDLMKRQTCMLISMTCNIYSRCHRLDQRLVLVDLLQFFFPLLLGGRSRTRAPLSTMLQDN